MKKLLLALCLILALSLSGFAISCSSGGGQTQEPVQIELENQAIRAEMFLGEEFDVMDIVLNADPNLNYSITELYYLDGSFTKHNVEYSGTKFTYNQPYKLYVTLIGKSGNDVVAEGEFTLDYSVKMSGMVETYLLGGSDQTALSLVVDPSVLTNGATYGIKLDCLSMASNPVGDGMGHGSLSTFDGTSITSYDNMVLTAEIYNTEDFDLQLGLLFYKNNQPWTNDGNIEYSRMLKPFILKAGEWTKVSWSMRALSVTSDIFTDGVKIMFKVRIPDTTGLTAPYSYTTIFTNIDFVDYSAEKFPDLETRTPAEIVADIKGDTEDKFLATHALANSSAINANYAKTTLTANVKEYTALSGITAPTDLTASTSAVEYGVQATAAIGNYYSLPINLRSGSSATSAPVAKELLDSFDVKDWTNAKLGFWVYNDCDIPLSFKASSPANLDYWGGKTIAVAASKTWQYVEFSLKDDYGVVQNVFQTEDYNIKVFAVYAGAGYDTADTYQNLNGKFYIDGFKLYSDEKTLTVNDYMAGNYTVDNTVFSDNGSKLPYMSVILDTEVKDYVALDIDAPNAIANPTNCIMYSAVVEQAYTGYYSNPINFSNAGKSPNPISDELLAMVTADMVNWSTEAYVGFWVYNPNAFDVTFIAAAPSGEIWNNNYSFVAAPGQWTYIEFDLNTHLGISKNIFAEDEYIFRLFMRFYPTPELTEQTYSSFLANVYIDGFRFFNKGDVQPEQPGEPDTPQIPDTVNGHLLDNVVEQGNLWRSDSGFHGNINYKGHLDATVEAYSNSFAAPTALATSPDYIKYTLTNPDLVGSGNYYGYLLAFNRVQSQYIDGFGADDKQIDEAVVSVLDWTNAKVSFYILYNGVKPLELWFGSGGTISGTPLNVNASTEWQLVTFDLAGKYTSNPFEGDGYDLRLYYRYADNTLVAGELEVTFYLDGFKIYCPTGETNNGKLLDNVIQQGSSWNKTTGVHGDQNYHGWLESSVEKYTDDFTAHADLVNSPNYIKYVLSNPTKVGSGNYYGYLFAFVESKDEWKELDEFQGADRLVDTQVVNVIDWTKAQATLYILYNGAQPLTLWAGSGTVVGSNPSIVVNASTEWQKITFDLAGKYTSNPFEGDGYDFRIYYRYSDASLEADALNVTFYVDGFSIYSPAPSSDNEVLLDNVIEKADEWNKTTGVHGDQNYKGHVDASVEEYTDDFTAHADLVDSPDYIKYTLTNPEKVGSGNYYGYLFAFVESKDEWKELDEFQGADRLVDMQVVNVTDWTKAQATLYILYNGAQPLTLWAGSGTVVGSNPSIVVNASTEWQKITFDLAGKYTSNPFEGDGYDFRIYYRYSDASLEADALNVTFYVDGFSIYNETSNSLLLENYTANTQDVNANYGKTTVSASEVKYADLDGISAPSALADSTSAVKYVIAPTGAIGNYYSNPINFANTGAKQLPISDKLLDTFTVTDWSDAYVGFWVYNDTDIALTFKGTASSNRDFWSGTGVTVESKTWSYVELSLKDVFGITTNIFAEDTYNLKIFSMYSGANYSTADTYQNFSGLYYIDGFNIYNKTAE